VDIFKPMSELESEGQQPRWEVASLWHNAFESLVKHSASAQSATVVSAAEGELDVESLKGKGLTDHKSVAVVASVKQGKDLLAYAKMVTTINKEVNGKLIVAPQTGRYDIKITDALTFTVIGPRQSEIDDLQKEWEKSKAKHGTDEQAVAADYLNRTVPNLSSIVFLAEQKSDNGKPTRILMTGDAGGDLILQGLQGADLLDSNGRIRLDILKLQHHGSNHSVDETFFRRVIADVYVISGNGKHGIPHMNTLAWLSTARSGDQFDVYMTNRHLQNGEEDLTKGLDTFLAAEAQTQPQHRYHFREESALSVLIGR
jgi:hypothetical protein